MINKKSFAIPLGLFFTSCVFFSLALAQSSAFYQSSESFSSQGDCLGCNQGSSYGSEVSGTVGDNTNNVAELTGDLSANVISPTVSGGGGGGVVSPVTAIPLAQQYQYATPTAETPQGSGYEPATTSQPVPTLPNTALGDDQKLFYILLAGLVLLGEMLVLARSRSKKEVS